jgi:diguanylate cyclase (GGDEF)-like protein
MVEPLERIDEQFRALYASFAESLPARVTALADGWQRWLGQRDKEALSVLIRLAHTLVGSGATFGYAGVSETARILEAELERLNGEEGADDRRIRLIERLLEELGSAARDTQRFPAFDSAPPLKLAVPESPQAERLLLVDPDPDEARKLADLLTPYGYLTLCLRPEDLGFELARDTPLAVLTETGVPPDERAGIALIRRLRENVAPFPPVIFITRNDDIRTRLEAVRAGGAAYLSKPVDLTELLGILRGLSAPGFVPAYRVLIVDDDEPSAYHSALVLERAGINTRVITNPLAILETLQEFQPEVILLDLYMPECNGMEVARVIRQHAPLAGAAIVFFSVESDIDRQLEAMRLGGDDFLIKPMEAGRLVAAVEARARRARLLLSLMREDGLTAVLNHAAFMEQLSREFSLAQRTGIPLALAMIDLDFFKSVNDVHGHAAGDAVLRGLAHVFRQRLRGTDLVGRYGGEEFAVLLPNSDAAAAFPVIDGIRQAFAAVWHKGFEQEFRVTFSAGLADYPACGCPGCLLETADRALYQAKALGRNRVMLGTDMGNNATATRGANHGTA